MVMVAEPDAHFICNGAFLDAADEQVRILFNGIFGQLQGV